MSGAPSPGRRTTSQARVLDNLRLASRKGDRTALALALDEMRTLAFSPRYWVRYLTLVQHPLARIVDMLVIKQGERIARQKGWSPGPRRRPRPGKSAATAPRRRPGPEGSAPPPARRARTPSRRRHAVEQPPLFPGL